MTPAELARLSALLEPALIEAGRIHRSHGTVAAYRSQRLAQIRSHRPRG